MTKQRKTALRRLRAAAKAVLRDYDACSGYEPSLSLLHRTINVKLRGAIDAMQAHRKQKRGPV